MEERFVYYNPSGSQQDRVTIQLWMGDEIVGSIFLRKGELLPKKKDSEPHTPCLQVSGIDVVEKFRRKRFGTKLYEEAARVAAQYGLSLCSDVPGSLDPKAQAFWEKQVEKGRAFWEVPGPPEMEGENYGYGRYVLKFPPPVSLAGRNN